MGKFNFDELTRSAYERQGIAFAIFQYIDDEMLALLVSDGLCCMLDTERSRLLEFLNDDFFGKRDTDGKSNVRDELDDFIKNRSSFDYVYRFWSDEIEEAKLIRMQGSHFTAEDGTELIQMLFINEEGQADGFSGKELEGSNYYDLLTGLPNMSYFMLLAPMHFEDIRQRGENFALISLNLTGMKGFNARYGMEEGDHLLVNFADLLRKKFSNRNCSRFGEDHFYVFTQMDGLDEKIDSLIQDMKTINGGRTLPVRVGIYNKYDANISLSTACDRARMACDRNRTTYISQIVYFTEDMEREILKREYIIKNFEDALEKNYITVHYQPQFRVITGKLCGAEALARWDTPEYGLLMPDDFVPVLEENNLTYKLEEFVLEQICRDFISCGERWLQPVPISFNFSRSDFLMMDPVEMLKELEERTDMPKGFLQIEITEEMLIQDPENMGSIIKGLHENGVRVILDDFGGKYFSLNDLGELHFDVIKIDMQTVKRLNDRTKMIVESFVSLAKGLGIHIMAESVEDQEEADYLKLIGCEIVQGYYYEKPKSFDETLGSRKYQNMRRENLEERAFYEEVGKVNLISEHAGSLVFYNGSKFDVKYRNKRYVEMLKKGGSSSQQILLDTVNSLDTQIGRDFKEGADRAVRTGGNVKYNFTLGSRKYSIETWDIAGYSKGHMLRVFLHDITGTDEERLKGSDEELLKTAALIYNKVYLFDMEKNTVRMIRTDDFVEEDGRGERAISHLFLNDDHIENVYPGDRERYRRFFDRNNIRERLEKNEKKSCFDLFRIKNGRIYRWIWFRFVEVPDTDMKKAMLCLNVVSGDDKDAFVNFIKRFEGLQLEENGGEKKQSKFYKTINDPGFLWKSLMDVGGIRFFWKNQDRRFCGASKSFLAL